jgi:hypothetical protein
MNHPLFSTIQSDFLILPGEVRQVVLPSSDAEWLFSGYITSNPSFDIVGARSSNRGQLPGTINIIPEDLEPDAAEWCSLMTIMKPGERVVLLVRNVSDGPARYRARLR